MIFRHMVFFFLQLVTGVEEIRELPVMFETLHDNLHLILSAHAFKMSEGHPVTQF